MQHKKLCPVIVLITTKLTLKLKARLIQILWIWTECLHSTKQGISKEILVTKNQNRQMRKKLTIKINIYSFCRIFTKQIKNKNKCRKKRRKSSSKNILKLSNN